MLYALATAHRFSGARLIRGRGGGSSTPDPLLPEQMRYQLAVPAMNRRTATSSGRIYRPSTARPRRDRESSGRPPQRRYGPYPHGWLAVGPLCWNHRLRTGHGVPPQGLQRCPDHEFPTQDHRWTGDCAGPRRGAVASDRLATRGLRRPGSPVILVAMIRPRRSTCATAPSRARVRRASRSPRPAPLRHADRVADADRPDLNRDRLDRRHPGAGSPCPITSIRSRSSIPSIPPRTSTASIRSTWAARIAPVH